MFPKRFNRYFEPFLGGGAVFFHLEPERSILSDINVRLIDCYRAVRDRVEELIGSLERLRRAHCEAHYYEIRDRFNQSEKLSPIERAAYYIYLNKTCFNGLYRENRKGHFNVPIGRYHNPGVYCPDNLRWASQLLAGAVVMCAPFEEILAQARAGDFVYLDPPYYPLNRTSNFTAYTRQGFDAFDQSLLAQVFRELDRRGCLLMQSNSNTPAIRQLYQGYDIGQVQARRNINSKGRRRGPIGELVIRNYTRTSESRKSPALRESSAVKWNRAATER